MSLHILDQYSIITSSLRRLPIHSWAENHGKGCASSSFEGEGAAELDRD